MRAHKKLLNDPLAYVEHFGKHDRHHMLAALQDGGKDTILRVCMAPQERIPYRALGYLATLEHIGREYLPHAQKQFVTSVHTAQRVNGVSQKALDTTIDFLETAWLQVPRLATDTTSQTLFLFDRPDEPNIDIGRLNVIMRHSKEKEQLEKQASRRGSDYLQYLAAHIAVHDMVDSIYAPPYLNKEPEAAWSQASRIISIGAQSERPFYEARMRYREFSLHSPDLVKATAQVFTQQSLPPYISRRQPSDMQIFDPSYDDITAVLDPSTSDPWEMRFDPVLRDVAYALQYGRAMHESYAPFTKDSTLEALEVYGHVG